MLQRMPLTISALVLPKGKPLNICVILYATYPPPNYIEDTNANSSAHAFKPNWFRSEEKSTTRRARGYLKQIYSWAMSTPN